MHASILLTLFASLAAAGPYRRYPSFRPANSSCPIVFDGRIPSNASLTDFDTENGGGWNPFNPGFVKGNDLEWSDILLFPSVPPSRFDIPSHARPVEVTISDESIFQKQFGFRRAGLMFQKDTNEDSPASEGIKTIHFSVLQDESRSFNLSHEYLNVWHEAADFSGNQFNIEAGTLIGRTNITANTWKLLNRDSDVIWSTPMLFNVWQNFAVTLDFDKNTLQAWYSEGHRRLRDVTGVVANDNSGQGQYQLGILKKPTGTSDVVNSGFQEDSLNEGLIYGGIFIEDSRNNCVSV